MHGDGMEERGHSCSVFTITNLEAEYTVSYTTEESLCCPREMIRDKTQRKRKKD